MKYEGWFTLKAEKVERVAESAKKAKAESWLTLKAESGKKRQSTEFFVLSGKISKLIYFNFLHFPLHVTRVQRTGRSICITYIKLDKCGFNVIKAR